MTIGACVLVDACVAMRLGKDQASSRPAEIRKALNSLSEGPVGVMMTPKLRLEWDLHATRYMRRWLASMSSRRRITTKPDKTLQDFRNAVRISIPPQEGQAAVIKDAHLTEAAIFYHAAVCSTDDQQRRLLRRVAVEYQLVGSVQWFNPEDQAELIVAWAASGGSADFGAIDAAN